MKNQPFTTLAIESSTSACSVALSRDDAILAVRRITARGQAEALIPAIGEIMAEAGLAWTAIDLIGVTVGPGSFTGLRIGLSAARGLALARRIPLAGVTTADLFADAVPPERYRGRALLIAIDSKRDDLFVQAFGAGGAPLGDIRALTAERAVAWQDGPLLVVGDAAEQFRGLRADIEVTPAVPDAARLALLARRRFAAGAALPAQPLYLRPPDVTLPKPS